MTIGIKINNLLTLISISIFSSLAYSQIKLECNINYEGLQLNEKSKYTGSVILNISESKDYASFEIENTPIFMKTDNSRRIRSTNISIVDKSDAGKWDFSIEKRFENGTVKTVDLMLDRNVGKLIWMEYDYRIYPSQLWGKREMKGKCIKLDVNKKLF